MTEFEKEMKDQSEKQCPLLANGKTHFEQVQYARIGFKRGAEWTYSWFKDKKLNPLESDFGSEFNHVIFLKEQIEKLQAENETLKLEIRDLHNEIEDLNDEIKESEN